MKPSISFGLLAVVSLLLLSILACSLPDMAPPVALDDDSIATIVAGTMMAHVTPRGVETEMGETPASSSTPVPSRPTQTPPPTATLAPSSTPLPSKTPIATRVIIPTIPNIGELHYNAARFIGDVTIPDGTILSPGQYFTKIWRIQNIGFCTWNKDYYLWLDHGDSMGANTASLPYSVAPGEVVEIAVDMVAPERTGSYKGYWNIVDSYGAMFGFGPKGDRLIWVQIFVEDQPQYGEILNFAQDFCEAQWKSNAGKLPCPGREGDPDGFVTYLTDPLLENRQQENQPTLLTHPYVGDDGYISGRYPPIQIRSGDHFSADVGCLGNYKRCNVRFRVEYRAQGESIKKLGEYHETHDKGITHIDFNLSDLAGKMVEFTLTVLASNESSENAAFWLNPHIYRP